MSASMLEKSELRLHSCRDERLELRDIRRQSVKVLRQLLDSFQRGGTFRFAPQGFLNGLGELGGQRGLQTDQWQTGAALFQANLEAVGGMRVDHHAVFLPQFADGLQTILVRTLAGGEIELRQRLPIRRALNVKRSGVG